MSRPPRDRQAERAALDAAADRLLAGTPLHSQTGNSPQPNSARSHACAATSSTNIATASTSSRHVSKPSTPRRPPCRQSPTNATPSGNGSTPSPPNSATNAPSPRPCDASPPNCHSNSNRRARNSPRGPTSPAYPPAAAPSSDRAPDPTPVIRCSRPAAPDITIPTPDLPSERHHEHQDPPAASRRALINHQHALPLVEAENGPGQSGRATGGGHGRRVAVATQGLIEPLRESLLLPRPRTELAQGKEARASRAAAPPEGYVQRTREVPRACHMDESRWRHDARSRRTSCGALRVGLAWRVEVLPCLAYSPRPRRWRTSPT